MRCRSDSSKGGVFHCGLVQLASCKTTSWQLGSLDLMKASRALPPTPLIAWQILCSVLMPFELPVYCGVTTIKSVMRSCPIMRHHGGRRAPYQYTRAFGGT